MGCKPCCSHQNTGNNTIEFNAESESLKSPINKNLLYKKEIIDSYNSYDENNNSIYNEENNQKLFKNNFKYYYEIIEKINYFRKKHNVSPLIINNDINLIAQKYSNKIARENFIELSNNKYNNSELGEIIFTFNEKVSPEEIISSLYEKESYNYNYLRKNQKSSNFTQMIWKNSKYIGIGCTKTKENLVYTVINFYPQGNIKNEFLSNVFPPIDEDKKSGISSNSEYKIHFLEELLNANNEYRMKHNASFLTLNPSLITKANEYAMIMADNNTVEDKEIEYLGEKCGKNICVRNNNKYDGKEICDEWYNEIKEYDFFKMKNNNLEKVKNFTQLVWKETQEVGFGWAQSSDGKFYIVGLYYPCGNVFGKYQENVLPEENE